MIVEIKVKREDRKRAETLLELAGIKVYKPKGYAEVTGNASHPDLKIDLKAESSAVKP